MNPFGRRFEVPCTIAIAHTRDDCYAHVELRDVELGPGDAVQIHDAPTHVAYGQRLRCERRATVRQAGWLARWWTRLGSRFELTLLYEVSFSAGRLRPAPLRPPARRTG